MMPAATTTTAMTPATSRRRLLLSASRRAGRRWRSLGGAGCFFRGGRSGRVWGRAPGDGRRSWGRSRRSLNNRSLSSLCGSRGSTAGREHARKADVFGGVGQQGEMASPLQRDAKAALVLSARARLAAGFHLASVRDVTPQSTRFLVVDYLHLVDAEGADFPARCVTAASLPLRTSARLALRLGAGGDGWPLGLARGLRRPGPRAPPSR